MKFQNLSFVFIWSFLLMTLAFAPQHSLETPLSIKATFSWIGIFILICLIIKNLYKAQKAEYKDLALYFKEKLPFKDKELKESKASVRLVVLGGICWFLILIFKEGLFPLPLFILGSTLMVWGLSIFLEENGLYKFSESNLSNKWVLSAIFSSVLYWAGFKSAGQINSIFSVDPSLFPFTLAGMVVFNIATLFFLLMTPIFLISSATMMINFIREIVTKNKKNELIIFPIIIMFSAYASLFGLFMLSTEVQNKAVKLIALKTDFNSAHLCDAEWLKQEAVIFVGPNSNYVLAPSKEDKKEYQIQKCISL